MIWRNKLATFCLAAGLLAGASAPANANPEPSSPTQAADLAIPGTVNPAQATGSGSASLPADATQTRGVLKPLQEATISSEILGTITRMPIKAGRHFRRGDLLVEFDCSRHQAELAAAKAEYAGKKKTFDNNSELARYNAAAKLQVEVSQAEADKAAADVKAATATVGSCTIRAPWSGRVVETIAHEHETVGPGKELVKILNDSALEVEVLVPSQWLGWVSAGTAFQFRVDETGKVYGAKVTQVGAKVDPVSQTVRLTGALADSHAELLAGMSGTASFVKR